MKMMVWPALVFCLFWAGIEPATGTCKYYYSTTLKQKIYTSVDQEPAFPGGMAACQRFLNKNVRLADIDPSDVMTMSSTVTIQFIIDTNGAIVQSTILHRNSEVEEHTPLELAVLKAYRAMPAWTPGKCQGKTVAVQLKLESIYCFGE